MRIDLKYILQIIYKYTVLFSQRGKQFISQNPCNFNHANCDTRPSTEHSVVDIPILIIIILSLNEGVIKAVAKTAVDCMLDKAVDFVGKLITG